MKNTSENLEISVLMADNCTRLEAEKHLKNGTAVYSSIDEYIEAMKSCGIYNPESFYDDIRTVIYKNHKYIIQYVL